MTSLPAPCHGPEMGTTTKDRIVRVRRTADDLLHAPGLPVIPRRWREVHKQTDVLRPTAQGVSWATLSNSRLYTYTGAVLGARQTMLYLVQFQGFPVPPGFADAPPKYLATMAGSLAAYSGLDPRPVSGIFPLTKEAKAIIDAWEDSGLGHLATAAFHLSHLYYGLTNEWGALAPEAEIRA